MLPPAVGSIDVDVRRTGSSAWVQWSNERGGPPPPLVRMTCSNTAATCLQLLTIGQLHRPKAMSTAVASTSSRITIVEYGFGRVPRTEARSAPMVKSHVTFATFLSRA